MRCAVKSCKNNNKKRPCTISFFNFPSDPVLLRKWKSFCCRDKNMNLKTSQICMEHFKADDFENNLQFEMGFTKRRILRHGAEPTIRKISEKAELHKNRAQRMKKRENKKIVEMLLQEHDSATVLLRDGAYESLAQFEEAAVALEPQAESSEGFSECPNETLSPLFKAEDKEGDAEFFKKEVERLLKENAELRKASKKHVSEIRSLEDKRDKEARKHEYDLSTLRTQLNKVEYELSNLEEKLLKIFTKGQIAKLKAGIKRTNSTEENITQV